MRPPTAVAFPVVTHASTHYFTLSDGTPRPVKGLNAWSLIELPEPEQVSFINQLVARGFNHTEVWIPNGFTGTLNPWHDGNGNLPFTKRLDGTAWTGSRTYSNIANEAPDFTFPNEAYWVFADRLIDSCEARGVTVDIFVCYSGYPTTPVQGWNDEMVANGATKMEAYGTAIGTRWRLKRNIRWMLIGDRQTLDGSQQAVWTGLVTGLTGVTKVCNQYGAELLRNSIPDDLALIASTTNVQSAYAQASQVYTQCTAGYARNEPTYLMEAPFDETESSPPVGDANPDATQPIRRHCWRGQLASRGGYMVGTGWIFGFVAGWESHFSTQCLLDCARLNRWIDAHAWYSLVPTTALLTANAGTTTNDNYIVQAINAASNATFAVAYKAPAGSDTFTVDMSLFAGTVRARWFDPTNETYTAIDTYPNTGTQGFTVPGNNNQGTYDDWVLELDVL